jgi:outer membrane protein, multidrug efflux system
MRNSIIIFQVLLLLCVPAGCSLAPEYTRPETTVPDTWPEGDAYDGETAAEHSNALPVLKWKDHFPDERLQRIVETALESNRDFRIAALKVERARAMYGIQRAELFPAVNAAGSYARERVPKDFSPTGESMTTEQYSVSLGATAWELDFFGRVRNLEDKALEEYGAMEQAHRAAAVILASEVASVWFALAADRENLDLAKRVLETRENSLGLIRSRYENGIASELDLQRARTQVETARGDVALFTRRLAQDENAISLLAGTRVLPDLLPSGLNSVDPPVEVSPGLSSEVLLSRPDVLAAEHRLKAAHANIGAARASFFPRITLTSSIGTASGDLSGLFGSGSETWNFVPRITIPIFDRRIRPAYEVTKVEREMAVAEYEKAIQSAFREVADALADWSTLERRVAAQEALVEAAAETFRISEARYNDGIDSYLSVLDAQRSLYVAQQGLISLRLEQLVNQVNLYKALGGWTE